MFDVTLHTLASQDMGSVRSGLAAAVVGGHVYAFGGYDGSTVPLSS